MFEIPGAVKGMKAFADVVECLSGACNGDVDWDGSISSISQL